MLWVRRAGESDEREDFCSSEVVVWKGKVSDE